MYVKLEEYYILYDIHRIRQYSEGKIKHIR